MISLEQLATLCADPDDKPKLAMPWRIERDGEPWSVATNGYALLAVKGAIAEPREDAPAVDAVWPIGEPSGSLATTRAALAEWCGVCLACGNLSRERADRYVDYGRLFGIIFNRHVIGAIVGAVPDGLILLESFVGEGKAIRLTGDGWLALAMPLREADGVEDQKNAPRFEDAT